MAMAQSGNGWPDGATRMISGDEGERSDWPSGFFSIRLSLTRSTTTRSIT